jgi:uncharacterized membrane protein
MVTAARTRRVHGIHVDEVEDAIRAAERRTSSEIRVAIARFYFWGDVYRAAQRSFARLRMERTDQRNAVLIFVAPWRHRFVLLGDIGLRAKLPVDFWRSIAARIGERFRHGDLTGGLVYGIDQLGLALAAPFPFDPATDRNQLPDDVVLPGGRASG